MADFSQAPSTNVLSLSPFSALESFEDYENFNKLKYHSALALPSHVNYDFLRTLKREWDLQRYLYKIDEFPNYTTFVDGHTIHFTALFSSNPSTTNLLLLHNFPASPHQFIPLLHLIREKYPTPKALPYNIIVPSLPGYAYSGDVLADLKISQAANVLDLLMKGLFGSEAIYIAHGGDLGSFIARDVVKPELEGGNGCVAAHVTMMRPPGPSDDLEPMDEEGKACLAQVTTFQEQEGAMLALLASKPELVAEMLSASPLALAAWVGHMLREWVGWTLEDDLDKILEILTVCWVTQMYSRGLWHSRALLMEGEGMVGTYAKIEKPTGYSLFEGEIVSLPKAWAEKQCNLVFFRKHDAGGHFAAMQRPRELLEDLEEFVQIVNGGNGKP